MLLSEAKEILNKNGYLISETNEHDSYKDYILNNTNLYEHNGYYTFKGFEKDVLFYVNFIKKEFYKIGGYFDAYYIWNIPGIEINESEQDFILTVENVNLIENWLHENINFVKKKSKKRETYEQDITKDIENYKGKNWSGD